MSAVLPFFTFSITAPIEPSSNSLPPTTFSPSMLLLLPEPGCFRNTMWPMIFWPSLLVCQDNGCYEARRTGFFGFCFSLFRTAVSLDFCRGFAREMRRGRRLGGVVVVAVAVEGPASASHHTPRRTWKLTSCERARMRINRRRMHVCDTHDGATSVSKFRGVRRSTLDRYMKVTRKWKRTCDVDAFKLSP